MLHRAMWEGGSIRSSCRRDTVVHTHHLGLHQHYAVARESVEADTADRRRVDFDGHAPPAVHPVAAGTEECRG